jgi:hypothetical protein
MQMLQQKDKVTILYANDNDGRHVYMNRTHPEHVTPEFTVEDPGVFTIPLVSQDYLSTPNGQLAGIHLR